MTIFNKNIGFNSTCLVLFLLFCSFTSKQTLPLNGKWKFQTDPQDKGVKERWFSHSLSETIKLPGSMAENLKGDDITLKTKWTGSIYDSSFYFNPRLAKYRQEGNIKIPFWLTPAKHYVGAAWYQKVVNIPKKWKEQRIVLYLERAHIETRVWIDDREEVNGARRECSRRSSLRLLSISLKCRKEHVRILIPD